MSFNTLSFSKAMAGLAMVSIALATPLKQETSLLGKAIPLQKRDCTGQHIFHSSNEGEAAMNKQNWVNMGLTATDLAIIMKEDAGRPTVQEDEDGAPGHFAFTIFNINWWMVKVSCPEFTPEGYSPSSGEDQIPPEIFQKLNFDQSAALQCLHQSMNDPFYNRAGEPPTSQDNPSPAWWGAQRGGPSVALDYLNNGVPLPETESDYMWNTLGIRDWIVNGGHMTDDWIESSCLSGLTGPAPCPAEFENCGAGYL